MNLTPDAKSQLSCHWGCSSTYFEIQHHGWRDRTPTQCPSFFEPNKTKSFFSPLPWRESCSRNQRKKTQLFSEEVNECKKSMPIPTTWSETSTLCFSASGFPGHRRMSVRVDCPPATMEFRHRTIQAEQCAPLCVVYMFLENLDFVHWRTTAEGHFCLLVSDSAPRKVIASNLRNSRTRRIGRHNNLEHWWGDTMWTRFDIVFAKFLPLWGLLQKLHRCVSVKHILNKMYKMTCYNGTTSFHQIISEEQNTLYGK